MRVRHLSRLERRTQRQGVIRDLEVSNPTADQVAEARAVAAVVWVQDLSNLAHRQDDDLVDDLAEAGTAYVPFFPLGGFTPLQSDELATVSARLDATPTAVALSWLLHRSPNVLLIPGTWSVAHLHDNIAGAALVLPDDDLADLDRVRGRDLLDHTADLTGPSP